MSRKKIFQLVSIVFLLIGVFLLIPGTDWQKANSLLPFISVILGTLGSIISIFIPTSYTIVFTDSDWISSENGERHLIIQAATHGQGISPTVQVFQKMDGGYSEIGTDIAHKMMALFT